MPELILLVDDEAYRQYGSACCKFGKGRISPETNVILLRRHQDKACCVGAGNQRLGFSGGVAVVVVKAFALGDGHAGFFKRREKLLGIADAGEGQHLSPFKRGNAAAIRHQATVEKGDAVAPRCIFQSAAPSVEPITMMARACLI